VINALDMAIRNRRPGPGGSVHADHGVQGGFNRSSQHLNRGGVFRDGDRRLEQEDERCARGAAAAVAR